jgi:hypothetical protein
VATDRSTAASSSRTSVAACGSTGFMSSSRPHDSSSIVIDRPRHASRRRAAEISKIANL